MQIDKSLISYRNFEGYEIPILHLKKGTLLFRLVHTNPIDNTNITDMMDSTFLGIKETKTDFCLSSSYNVFFYPYPYIFDTNKYLKPTESKMVLFETTKELNIALLLKPSKYTRISKNEKNDFMITCDNFVFCDNKKGRYNDPCFTEEFMKQNPDVVGMYGIQQNDSRRFMSQFNSNKFKPFKKFIHLHQDDKSVGVPEMILYPLISREMKDINTKVDRDVYDIIKENENKFNYKIVNIFDHKPYEVDELYKYMKTDIRKEYQFNKLSGFYERI